MSKGRIMDGSGRTIGIAGEAVKVRDDYRYSIGFDRVAWITENSRVATSIVLTAKTNIETWPGFGQRAEHPEDYQTIELMCLFPDKVMPCRRWFGRDSFWGATNERVAVMEEWLRRSLPLSPE